MKSGPLPAGATATVTASLDASASSLDSGNYDDSVSFVNTSHAIGNTSRSIDLTVLPRVELRITVNNPQWGTVSPTGGRCPAGSAVELLASPETYFYFAGWGRDAAGAENPLELVLKTDCRAEAIFAEVLTAQYPTPHWWLAAPGLHQ